MSGTLLKTYEADNGTIYYQYSKGWTFKRVGEKDETQMAEGRYIPIKNAKKLIKETKGFNLPRENLVKLIEEASVSNYNKLKGIVVGIINHEGEPALKNSTHIKKIKIDY